MLKNLFLKTKYQPWVCLCFVTALFGVLWLIGPQQIPVVIYKLLLPLLGGAVLLFAWVALVPMGNPARYLADDWRNCPDADKDGEADFQVVSGYHRVFCMTLKACALVFSAGALAVSMGL